MDATAVSSEKLLDIPQIARAAAKDQAMKAVLETLDASGLTLGQRSDLLSYLYQLYVDARALLAAESYAELRLESRASDLRVRNGAGHQE